MSVLLFFSTFEHRPYTCTTTNTRTRTQKNESIQQFSIVLSHLMSQCGLLLSIHFAIFALFLCAVYEYVLRDFINWKGNCWLKWMCVCVGFLLIHHSGLFYMWHFAFVSIWCDCHKMIRFMFYSIEICVMCLFLFISENLEPMLDEKKKAEFFFMVNIFHGRSHKK